MRTNPHPLLSAFAAGILSLALAPPGRAQLVVTDPASDALSQIQHLEDFAKQIEQIQKQVEQINLLTQQLRQVEAYVKAFGDPEKLTSIVGVDGLLGSLQTSGVGKTLADLQHSATGAGALRYDASGLFQRLDTSFTTPSGTTLPRAEELYRKFGAVQDSSRNFQSVTDDVLARRANLRQQISATTQQLQSASTDAETQKLAGVLVGYTAELAAVDREIEHAAAQLTAQDIENRNDRERQETARREERRAQLEEGFRRSGEAFRLDTTAPAFPRR
jgi:hypothetical protein